MLAKIKAKKELFVKQYQQLNASESITVFRIYTFLSSSKGRKKTIRFVSKVIKFFLKEIFGYKPRQERDYKMWRDLNALKPEEIQIIHKKINDFTIKPKISILLPTYNSNLQFLEKSILSVKNQFYSNWELCISDDNSTDENVKLFIKKLAEEDKRIKAVYRKENGHISANTNSALEIATGDYIAFIDHDDCLALNALYENVLAINEDGNRDFIYSDEDLIDINDNHSDAYFKSDWCPDSFLARNYINHFTVIKKDLIKEIGGFREGFEGAQDYDLYLRATEKAKSIYHIPKILYHWRIHKESTAGNSLTKPYAYISGVKALEETLKRRNLKGTVQSLPNTQGYYQISYDLLNKENDLVSIIIPTKNKHELCEVAIKSVFDLSTYQNFEIILVNNNSDEPAFFEWVKTWEKKEPKRFKCIEDNGSFNFSRLMNNGSKIASGKYLLLLNNDIKVIEPQFITNMVRYCQLERIGIVGAKLIFSNNTIQHAGVVIGLGGIAGHVFVGLDKEESGYFKYLISVNNYSALTAACLMVRKSVFDQVNGFEEKLAVEFNDVDFCLKVKDAGYDNVYLPNVELYHYESISRGHPHKDRKSYIQHVNDLKFFEKKWKKYIEHDPCYNSNLSMIYTDFRLKIMD